MTKKAQMLIVVDKKEINIGRLLDIGVSNTDKIVRIRMTKALPRKASQQLIAALFARTTPKFLFRFANEEFSVTAYLREVIEQTGYVVIAPTAPFRLKKKGKKR